MAKFNPGSIVSEIMGSVGDVTYSKNAYGNYSKQKLQQTVRNTGYQLIMRNALAAGVSAYQSLSDTEFKSWSLFCQQHVKSFRLSRKNKLDAFNEFIGRYINAACLGVSTVSTTAEPANSEFSSISEIRQGSGFCEIDITTINYSGVNEVAIYASDLLSAGIRSLNQSSLALIGHAVISSGLVTVDISDMFGDRFLSFGTGIPKRIFIAVKNIRTDNYAGGVKSYNNFLTDGTFPEPLAVGYQAIINYAVANGIALPSIHNQRAGNSLYIGLSALGVISNADLLYIMASGVESEFTKLNWANPSLYKLSANGSPLYTSKFGWTGSVGNYFKSSYNPFVNGVNFKQANGSMTSWISSNSGVEGYDAGCALPGVSHVFISAYNTSAGIGTRGILCRTGSSFISGSITPSFQIVTNRSSTLRSIRRYPGALSSASSASVAMPNFEMYVLAWNNGGVAAKESQNRLSFLLVANDQTANFDAIRTLVNTYMQSLI